MPSIKGTASVTDNRALHKRLASVKFPTNFNEKLNVESINRPILTQWIEDKITELLGFEDEIVQSTAVNLFLPTRLEDGPTVRVDPKRSQIDLEGFLGEAAAAQFTTEVWDLLLDAQSSGVGVPRKLVEEKKKELEAQKAAAAARRPFWDGRSDGRGGGPPAPHYQQHQQRSHRGPPPPVAVAAARQQVAAHPRRSISPERGGGGRDEFGRRPSSYDRPRRGHEGDRRSRGEGDHHRRYDDRRSSQPHGYRREVPPREEGRRFRDGGRSRYSSTDGDDRRAIPHRRTRSRSRSPPPRRGPRRRSPSSSSSSQSSSRSGGRRARRGRSRGSSHD